MQTISSAPANRFNRLVGGVSSLPLPKAWQRSLLSRVAGFMVPYLGTSSMQLEEATPERAVLTLRNRRKVQNHMKTVHASAMFLLAEAATGVVLSANLPDASRFATTRAEVEYVQKSVGDLRAVATLTAEQRARIVGEASGRLTVPVTVTDESGREPARFTVEWSWKHRAAG